MFKAVPSSYSTGPPIPRPPSDGSPGKRIGSPKKNP